MKGEGDQTLRWASFLTSCSMLRWVLLSRDLKVEEALPMEAVSANIPRKQAAKWMAMYSGGAPFGCA